jgi:hypothetical protein
MLTRIAGMLHPGNEKLILDATYGSATDYAVDFDIQSDTVLLSLYVPEVTDTVQVTAYTVGDGQDPVQLLEIIKFPEITAPLSGLLLRKAALALDTIRVRVVTTGAAKVQVRAKAIATGEATVQVRGQTVATNESTSASTTAGILIAAELEDRAGLIIKNNNLSGILYIGFDNTLSTANGYPLAPGESLGMAIAAGQDIYGLASAGTIDVRILQAGG